MVPLHPPAWIGVDPLERAPRAIEILETAEAALPDGEASARAQLLATRGGTFIELGDGAQAEPDLRQAVRLRRETGGLKTGLVWFTQAQLGEALTLQGRLDEAARLQREAAHELRELLGPGAYHNALVAQRYSKTLEVGGDFEGAAAQWREAARLVERTYGLDHFGHLDMSSRLAAALPRTPAGRAEAVALSAELLGRWAEREDVGDRVTVLRALRRELGVDGADAATVDFRRNLSGSGRGTR